MHDDITTLFLSYARLRCYLRACTAEIVLATIGYNTRNKSEEIHAKITDAKKYPSLPKLLHVLCALHTFTPKNTNIHLSNTR